MVNFTLWPLYPGERTPMLIQYDAGWTEELVATDIKKAMKGWAKECSQS